MNVQVGLEMIYMECGHCGVPYYMTETLYDECRETGKTFYCPNGHPRVFRETDIQKLEKQLAEVNRKLSSTQFELMTAEKKLKTVERRIKRGVCPCCRRQFVNLQKHMAGQHPDYAEVKSG